MKKPALLISLAAILFACSGWISIRYSNSKAATNLTSPIEPIEYYKHSPLVTPTRDEIRHHYLNTDAQTSRSTQTTISTPTSVMIVPLLPLSGADLSKNRFTRETNKPQ